MTAPAGYNLVFADEFSTLSVSASRTADANWYSGQPWGGSFGEARFVSASASNSPFSIVKQGGESALRINMTRDASGQLQSGLISNTFPDGTSKTPQDGNPYGYYEARMWLPQGTGIWPAFWGIESERLSADRDHVVEVDVMENYGTAIPTQFSSVVHDWNWAGKTLEGETKQYARATPGAGVVSSGWHTYGVEITPERMTFYFDDRAYWSIATPATLDSNLMFMINLAAGGGWPIDPNLKDVSLYVDYFRAYEARSASAPVLPVVTVTTSGGTTNKATQTLTGTVGTAYAGTTVSILDGGKVIGTTTVKSDGSWSAKVTLTGEGKHTLTAKDTDSNGNTGTSKAVTIVLDTVAPAAPFLELAGPIGKAVPNPLAAGTAEPGATVTLYDGTKALATTTANAVTGVYSFGNLPALAAGTHVLTARAQDAAGNLGKASLAQTVVIAADGTLSSMTRVHADGSKDIDKTGITGQNYTDEHLVYDTKGNLTAISRAHADGSPAYGYSYDPATGTKITDLYDAAGTLTSHAVVKADGSSETFSYARSGTGGASLLRAETAPDLSLVSHAVVKADGSSNTVAYGSNGLVTQTQIHADKSKIVDKTGITGQNYTDEHLVYDAKGNLTAITRAHADGSPAYGYSYDPATGTKITDLYDAAGTLTSHGVVKADGSSDTVAYGSNGLVTQTQIHADKSKDIYKSGITGQSYTAEHSVLDGGGKVVLLDRTNLDQSHSQTAYKAGVTLTSTAGVTDLFKSAGGDTFVFAAGFGKDTVTGFQSGAETGHDLLVLDASQAASFADLQARHMITASGSDTLIKLSATDTILLKNVKAASLTADDFHFQDHGLFHT
ncbi:Ig-like domain-containing protein [Methylobacterium organophilum]|uniref:glycoside hydrolase family 16 protein n=1 Tax=Methylobacterium organophilum TaxID=410 RepID=UPI001F131CAB|nr:glycoside hydrolase family 16 protein [Methylobacterium organophilum]UMY16014.1 Ig-like domain-containing protein [Methylobacterium organophilum]